MFRWEDSKYPAERIGIDLAFNEISGNVLAFLDTRLENDTYVTLGMRDFSSRKQIHMSVFNPNVSGQPFDGFHYCVGNENDVYCIGDYYFELSHWYRFEIIGDDNFVEGQIFDYSKKSYVKVARFSTGSGSMLKKGNRNSISLEHVGLKNPCDYRSAILIKNPFRVDINGNRVTATKGQVKYQECDNSCIEDVGENIIKLSHGGVSKRKNQNNDWIDWV
jgi:hypothetical protein